LLRVPSPLMLPLVSAADVTSCVRNIKQLMRSERKSRPVVCEITDVCATILGYSVAVCLCQVCRQEMCVLIDAPASSTQALHTQYAPCLQMSAAVVGCPHLNE
jgi:hypothetical protein